MKRECDTTELLLGAYADKELDPEKTRRVQQHLETCADCRRELAQIDGLGKLIRSAQHPRLVDDYWDWQRDRVWRQILSADRRQAPSRRPVLSWARLVMPAVSAVVLLVVVIAGWRMISEKSPLTGKGVVAEQKLAQQPSSTAAEDEHRPVAAAKSVGAGAVAEQGPTQVAGTGHAVEKSEIDYAASGAGKASTAGQTLAANKVAHDSKALDPALAQATSAERAGASRSRIITGPVLEWQPPVVTSDVFDTGTVLLSVKTDSAGRVLSAAVRRSSGSAKLDSVAVHQTLQSRFKAAVKAGRSVPSSFDYQFRIPKRQAQTRERQKPSDGQENADRKDQSDNRGDQKQAQPPEQSKPRDDQKKVDRTDRSDNQGDQKQASPNDSDKQQDKSQDGDQQRSRPPRTNR